MHRKPGTSRPAKLRIASRRQKSYEEVLNEKLDGSLGPNAFPGFPAALDLAERAQRGAASEASGSRKK